MRNEIILTTDYWDCECESNFIHRKAESFCEVCKTFVEEQPDSRVNEVETWLQVQRKDTLFLIETVDCFGNIDLANLKEIEQELGKLQQLSNEQA